MSLPGIPMIMALVLVCAFSGLSGEKERPSRFGAEHGRRDAAVAVERGDLHFIEIPRDDGSDVPLLATDGYPSPRVLWQYSVIGCGYRPPATAYPAECEGQTGADAPCRFRYDVEYVAAYNTAVYNHLKRHPHLIRRYAAEARSQGAFPDFPRKGDGIFADAQEPATTGTVHWLYGANDVPLCMAALPDGWTLDGNFAESATGLSFPGVAWIRIRNATQNLTLSLLTTLGARRSRAGGHGTLRMPLRNIKKPPTLPFLSARQLLGGYLEPLAGALHPGLGRDSLSGEGEDSWEVAELVTEYPSARGVPMRGTAVLSLWRELSGDGRGEEYWGVRLLVLVARPKAGTFSDLDALAILEAVKFSPELQEIRDRASEMSFSDDEAAPQAPAEAVALAVERSRRSGKVLALPMAAAGAVDGYTFPPMQARETTIDPAYSLVNALAEMLTASDSLEQSEAVAAWRAVSGQEKGN